MRRTRTIIRHRFNYQVQTFSCLTNQFNSEETFVLGTLKGMCLRLAINSLRQINGDFLRIRQKVAFESRQFIVKCECGSDYSGEQQSESSTAT